MLTHSAFHVQIQLHTLTVYAGCVDELFGDVFFIIISFLFFKKLVFISYFVPVPKTLMDWFFEDTGVKALASTSVNLNDSMWSFKQR